MRLLTNLLFLPRFYAAKLATFLFRDNIILTSDAGLGFCSALAVTNKVDNALLMCVGVLLVAILSCALVWLLKLLFGLIFDKPMEALGDHMRLIFYMIVISISVKAFSLIAQAMVPEIAIGIKAYIGLIVTNCIILGLVDPFGKLSKNIWEYRGPILKYCLTYSVALVLISVVREILGFGTLLNMPILSESWPKATFMVSPIGGFFGLVFWRMLIRPAALNRDVVCGCASESCQTPENVLDSVKTQLAIISIIGLAVVGGALAWLQISGIAPIPYHNAFSVMFLKGIVLYNFLGMCPLINQSRNVKSALQMGAAVTFVITCTTPLNWLANKYILINIVQRTGFPVDTLYDLTLYIVVIALFVQLLEKVIKVKVPAIAMSMGIFLPLITVNCAPFGSAIFRIPISPTFMDSLMFGLGDGMHWAMVCVILSIIRTQTINRTRFHYWDKDTLAFLILGVWVSIWTIFGQLG